ncbi:protoporphyrinogen oxidase [Anaerobacillus sp. MEB173]|uniref:protoporphyrinogen oxidase n=1 Tax=Anaerobacillus sp. MEB173 TaxID=3383345 RepID=UPI003F92655F
MGQRKQKVAIIGGGITGLTVAYYLQKEIRSNQLPIEFALIEAKDQLGGKIETDYTDGFVIEKGPDSFLARKQSAARLAKEVGMESDLLSNDTGKSYILKGGKLFPIPGGSIMGIPTKLAPFATTKLFSPIGKIRAAGDLILPRVTEKGADQSLGTFFRKRLGNEVVDNLIEPLLSGIYAGDIDKLSLMATFPQFYQVEQKHRSLILGMGNTTPKPKATEHKKSKPQGMFLTLRGGLQSFVDAIENSLQAGSVVKGVGIESVIKQGDQYELLFSNGRKEIYDIVIMATPHFVTRKAFSNFSFVQSLDEIPATSVATVALAYPASAIKQDIEGTGFVVAKSSQHTITACTWTHKKWRHSTPEGKVLLRCYVGRAGDDDIVYKSDDEIIQAVLQDLNSIMKIDQDPEFHIIKRWKKAMPQYVVGHKERIHQIMSEAEKEVPGVFLAGGSYEGVGLPDCIDQGEEAVKKIIEYNKRR